MARRISANLISHGQRLEQVRLRYDLTREQAANRAGLNIRTVSGLERQHRPSGRHQAQAQARLIAALARADRLTPANAYETCAVGVPYDLVADARQLLIRTAELPGTRRGLLAVLQDYRTTLFALTAGSEAQDNAAPTVGATRRPAENDGCALTLPRPASGLPSDIDFQDLPAEFSGTERTLMNGSELFRHRNWP